MSEGIIKPGQILTGSLFNEPMRVETVRPNGPDTWVVGLVGTQSERFRNVNLTSRDLESLTILDVTSTYDGDGKLLRLGLQAYLLGIAYEFDPYFGLSISRVDPLPQQPSFGEGRRILMHRAHCMCQFLQDPPFVGAHCMRPAWVVIPIVGAHCMRPVPKGRHRRREKSWLI